MYAIESRDREIAFYPPTEAEAPTNFQELSRISNGYYWKLVRLFPADFLIRGYRSIELTATLPVTSATQHNDDSPLSSRDSLISKANTIVVNPLWIVLLGVGIAIVRNRRLGLFLALLFGYYGLVNTVQFDIRNIFHHELWFWIAGGIVAEAAVRFGIQIATEGHRRIFDRQKQRLRELWNVPAWRDRVMVISAAAFVAVVLIPGVLTVARLYQTAQVKDFVQDAMEAGTPVQFGAPVTLGGDIYVYPVPRTLDLPDEDYQPFWGRARYLAVTFDPSGDHRAQRRRARGTRVWNRIRPIIPDRFSIIRRLATGSEHVIPGVRR
jgi:hypothetical protein